MTRSFQLEALRGLWPGLAVCAFLLALVGGSLLTIGIQSDSVNVLSLGADPYLGKIIRFTLWQATLSTLISIGLALPVARALARRSAFPGRHLLLLLMGLPVILPVIVAVFGILAVYGKNGAFNSALSLLGIQLPIDLYGLPGILLAHAFFNMPLVVRLLLPAWEEVAEENWKLASTLGMSGRALFRLVEWPAISGRLPGICLIVFLLCFTSFAVVLTLGGGPATTTIEVAIYQALRYEFEPEQAALLAVVQLGLCTCTALVLVKWFRVFSATQGRRTNARHRPDIHSRAGQIGDTLTIVVASLFLMLPVAAIGVAGLQGPVVRVLSNLDLWWSALRSLFIALGATVIATTLAMGLSVTGRFFQIARHKPRAKEFLMLMGSLSLAIPPMVIGTGLFLVALRSERLEHATLVLISLVNAVMILPYVLRSIAPPLIQSGEQYHRLCANLGIQGWKRLRIVDWPALRKPLAFALGLGGALSFGDMGVAALFDTHGHTTLPVMLYYQMSAYRFDEAAVTALMLTLMGLALFWLLDRLVRQ